MRIFVTAFLLLIPGAVFGQGDIRRVNFKNFTYMAHCLSEEPQKITVKNGVYSYAKQEDGYVDRFEFRIFEIKYGDVNGDRSEEAIILSVCNTGGTGNFSEGFVYSMKSGKPSLIARIPGGDRADGGLRRTYVDGGMLVVESNAMSDMGGLCCPEFVVTTKYRVAGGKLQKRSESKAPVDAPERIRFDPGKSGATFVANVGGSDTKKFVVGARAGQTLSVSIDVDMATLRMITEARVTEGIRNFRAVLPKSGDYVFEILNESATEQDIKVNVKIN